MKVFTVNYIAGFDMITGSIEVVAKDADDAKHVAELAVDRTGFFDVLDVMEHVYAPDSEDLIRWADGTVCYRYELPEMTHMSDDYEVIPFAVYSLTDELDPVRDYGLFYQERMEAEHDALPF